MDYQTIVNDLKAIPQRRTKDVDCYNKELIKNKTDVSFLKDYVLKDQLVYRTYFQVSLGLLNNYQDQFKFIEDHQELLQDWWHVDQLTQFIKRPVPFDYAYTLASQYLNSPFPFLRRWGYILFLMHLQKDRHNIERILTLFKDDDEYYVQMGAAWLLAEMAIYGFDLVYDFLKTSKLKYNILGKAIQKICDSFRITDVQKQMVKDLRIILKNN